MRNWMLTAVGLAFAFVAAPVETALADPELRLVLHMKDHVKTGETVRIWGKVKQSRIEEGRVLIRARDPSFLQVFNAIVDLDEIEFQFDAPDYQTALQVTTRVTGSDPVSGRWTLENTSFIEVR
ncbi:MAG: hypothetical protein WD894_23390 [Pirellulales bacterium]